MTKTNGSAPPDPLDEVDEAIAELEGENWDEVTGETHVHVAPGGHVSLGQSGKFSAVELPTKPDSGPPPPWPARVALSLVRAVDSWPKALVALALLLLVGLAIWRGVTLP